MIRAAQGDLCYWRQDHSSPRWEIQGGSEPPKEDLSHERHDLRVEDHIWATRGQTKWLETRSVQLRADWSNGRHGPSSIRHDQSYSRGSVSWETIWAVKDMILATQGQGNLKWWKTGSKLLRANLSSGRHNLSNIRHDQSSKQWKTRSEILRDKRSSGRPAPSYSEANPTNS